MEYHLDLVGGIAGDMFIAAMLDLRPDLEPAVRAGIARCGLPADVGCRLVGHDDGVLTGRRFLVERAGDGGAGADSRHDHHHHDHAHGHHHHHGDDHHDHHHDHDNEAAPHEHGHVAWRGIRERLAASSLEPEVRRIAIAIFSLLAEAEGAVHGVAPDDVAFHEVGAWDSIADIVGGAVIIAALNGVHWTASAVPLGSGRVRSAHGPLPVPAPATARLLQGFLTLDDGVAGERVTPTGAAILRYLCRDKQRAAAPRRLGGSGIGFGTRKLPGLSNCLRVLAFEAAAPAGESSIGVIEFEIDDASGEELARGLEVIRAQAGVQDVLQAPVFGKKGRMMMHVRILVLPAALEAAVALCFRETTTIGLRHAILRRSVLPRASLQVEVDERPIGVKIVARGETSTAKAEADDVASVDSHAGRARLRRLAEQAALERASGEEGGGSETRPPKGRMHEE